MKPETTRNSANPTRTAPELLAPELLAPAGNWDCARAAVAAGADAIYFGLDRGFNARARAANFSMADLPKLMHFLHRYGVKGFTTLNTLAFSDELESVEAVVREIAAAGVDAVLVQDLGLLKLIQRVAPGLEIHASTQMTMTSAENIAAIADLGVKRVVLARELSVPEIKKIHSQTNMPLEAFVHGALCVAYSGQCLTSESLGGRSANRGQCAQACRLTYELVCDGEDVDLGDQKYLLSPQDLAAYALVPDLIDAGVMSLKIEGRLKTPEYVANITRHYRQAIDAAVAGNPVEFTERDIEEMELSFSRGFSVGWLGGCDHKMLVPAVSSAKRGVLIGEVTGVRGGRVRVDLTGRLKAGDGVVFEGDRAAGTEQGGRVFAIFRGKKQIKDEVSGCEVELTFPKNSIELAQVRIGNQIWKNDDPALNRKLRKSIQGDFEGRPLSIDIHVQAAVGEPLTITVSAGKLGTLQLTTEDSLQAAIKHPLDTATLEKQFSRLGGTGFTLGNLTAEIETSPAAPMVPLSVLGALRKEMVTQLTAKRETQSFAIECSSEAVLPQLRRDLESSQVSETTTPTSDAEPQLHVLCRSMLQLQTAINHQVPMVYADFQDIREYKQAAELVKQTSSQLYLATPRIQKPDEVGLFRYILKQQTHGVLVRNLAGLQFFRAEGIACVADFSLNAANELTVDHLHREGAERITVSYDLNRDQLLELVRHTNVSNLEVVVHQHMPMFHMEHCVFCSVLSPGTNKTNCGRPCDVHQVKLRDRVGMEHVLKADVGCRNTLFNATPQSGAEAVPELVNLGLKHFRIEFLEDQPDQELRRTINLYRDLIAGKVPGSEVWKSLQAMNRVGVTRGTLEHRRDPLAVI